MSATNDLVVIESAAGGTLAHSLAASGKRILLLERADRLTCEPQHGHPKRASAAWRDLAAVDLG